MESAPAIEKPRALIGWRLLALLYERLAADPEARLTRNQLVQDYLDRALASVDQRFVVGDAARETQRVLENLDAVLREAGSSLDRVLRCDVYLSNLADFGAMNEVYARFFPRNPPARVTVQAARLPKDARVEIAAIAAI